MELQADDSDADGQPWVQQRVVVTLTGLDEVGVTKTVVTAAASAGAVLEDFRQSVVHKRLCLSIDLTLPATARAQQFYPRILMAARNSNLKADLRVEERPDVSAAEATKKTPDTVYAVTLLRQSEPISAQFLCEFGAYLEQRAMIVQSVRRLSETSLSCVEMLVISSSSMSKPELRDLRSSLYVFGKEHAVDVALQQESILRRGKRLVVMDMDSTLIQQEVIDELARHGGVYEQVQEITERAMQGELDFNESLAGRVHLLKGISAEKTFAEVIDNLVYTDGAHQLCAALKRLGYRLAVISGGFTHITGHVRTELRLDYDYANTMEVDKATGKFTGRTVGPVVNARRKADLLMTLAQLENISLDQVIAIGDGANDLAMLEVAGLGVAFNAKPAVQEAADFRLNQRGLDSVLYLLGYSEREQASLARQNF